MFALITIIQFSLTLHQYSVFASFKKSISRPDSHISWRTFCYFNYDHTIDPYFMLTICLLRSQENMGNTSTDSDTGLFVCCYNHFKSNLYVIVASDYTNDVFASFSRN